MNHVKIWPHDVPEGEWEDLKKMSRGKSLHWVDTQNGSAALTVVRTPGTVKGQDGTSKSGVLLRIDVKGGPTIVLETTLAIFLATADAFRGGEQFDANKASATKH
jgi:hypothetical protein